MRFFFAQKVLLKLRETYKKSEGAQRAPSENFNKPKITITVPFPLIGPRYKCHTF